MRLLRSIAILLLVPAALQGEETSELVRPKLLTNVSAVQPGQNFTIGVLFTIEPHWHIYWINPGDAGTATSVRFKLPEGYEVGDLQWPVPHRFESAGLIAYGYENELLLTASVRAPDDAKPGDSLTITAETGWLSCKEECIPGNADLSLTLPVKDRSAQANAELFAKWNQRLPVASTAVQSPLRVEASQPGRFTLEWREPPRKVEFYPATTGALDLTDIKLEHHNTQTQVTYTATIYDAAAIPDGATSGLVVYEVKTGERRGVLVPVKVKAN